MNFALDIIIVAILIAAVAIGYKSGFVKMAMRSLKFFIAFVLARIFGPLLANPIYTRWIEPGFTSKVTENLNNILGNGSLQQMVEDPNRPEEFTNILSKYGVGLPDIQEWLKDKVYQGTASVNEYVAGKLVEPIGRGIAGLIAFVLIFVVSLILLIIITVMMDKAAKLPGLNLINKLGGMLFGFVCGMLIGYVFVLLASYILPYLAANTSMNSIETVVDGTIFFKWFYNFSPFGFLMRR